MKEIYKSIGRKSKAAIHITAATVLSLIAAAVFSEYSNSFSLMKMTSALLDAARIAVFAGLVCFMVVFLNENVKSRRE